MESSVSMSKNNPAKNIYLQSKRASKIFDIPLSKAKTLIARVVYQCHDFCDLIKKFDNNSLKASVYPFCLIGPHATQELKTFFEKNVDHLCERFSKSLVKPFSYFALLRSVKFIFGLDALSVNLEVQHRFVFNQWGVFEEIEGNKHSIYFKDIKVNDVSYRILAVNVLTADTFDNLTIREISQLRVELTKHALAPIMWQSLKDWEDKILSIFSNSGSESYVVRRERFNDFAQPQNEHQKNFMSQISGILASVRKENTHEELKPVSLGDRRYYVIGYPICEAEFTKSDVHFYATKEHVANNRSVFAIGDGMICLDLFEHDESNTCISENIEYFSEFSAVIGNFKCSSKENIIIDGKLYRAYFRPCSEFEFERFFSVPLVVKKYL